MLALLRQSVLQRRRPDRIKRERRIAERAQRQCKQGEFMVITGDSVGAQCSAPKAAVDDCPFAIATDFDADRLHWFAAGRAAITRLLIQMARPEAQRTVVTVAGSPGNPGDLLSAADAGKGLSLRRVISMWHECKAQSGSAQRRRQLLA